MPSRDEVLSGVIQVANDWTRLAVFWHVYFGLILLFLFFGGRPAKPVLATLAAVPLLSVSALAWLAGNPFNAVVFVAAGLWLLFLAVAMESERISLGGGVETASGVLLVAFGWVYPHFLEGTSTSSYLYMAPLGLIPCPTLAMITGLSLLVNGFGFRAWSLTVALLATVYGIVGTLVLGVQIDWVLFAGGLVLLMTTIYRFRREAAEPRPYSPRGGMTPA